MGYDYDLFVIGAGSGGVRGSRIAASLGAKVAIAEDLYVGGTCVNVGCVPKKLFVYASHFLEDIHDAAGFGWQLENPHFAWKTLMQNKDKEIERLNGIYNNILANAGVELINARATILGPHEVLCAERKISAKYILVAVGGWPALPEFEGSEYIISSNEAFHLEELPEKALVVGGGYIGIEFAGIFNGLGVKTTLAYRGDLFLRGFDNSLRNYLAAEIPKKGINLQFNTDVEKIVKTDAGLEVKFKNGNSEIFGMVMYATGRKPKTQGLGLETADVKLNAKGAITVNENFQTSCPSVFAVGDVIDKVQLTPVALAEGTCLAHYLFGDKSKQMDYKLIPTAVFSQPEMSVVGITEEEAREQFDDDDVDVYQSEFKAMKHTLSGSDERTFMKLIVQKSTDKVLGAHMGGPGSADMVQGIAVALKAGATKTDFDSTIGIHPTSAEEFVTMRETVNH